MILSLRLSAFPAKVLNFLRDEAPDSDFSDRDQDVHIVTVGFELPFRWCDMHRIADLLIRYSSLGTLKSSFRYDRIQCAIHHLA